MVKSQQCKYWREYLGIKITKSLLYQKKTKTARNVLLAINKLEYNSVILQDYNVDQERMKGKGVNAFIGTK